MKTLIIHPEDDPSTSFLKQIYEDIPSRVITKNLPKNELINAVKKADNVIILGHGDKNGLFNTYADSKYIIDTNFAKLLEHKNCLLIWCYANEFVTNNKLHFNGISTGMFVSQQNELIYLDENFEFVEEIEAYQPMIDESNEGFAKILGRLIIENNFNDMRWIYENLKEEYSMIAKKGNEVGAYNNQLLFYTSAK